MPKECVWHYHGDVSRSSLGHADIYGLSCVVLGKKWILYIRQHCANVCKTSLGNNNIWLT